MEKTEEDVVNFGWNNYDINTVSSLKGKLFWGVTSLCEYLIIGS